jgi:hypothetical protein
MAKQTAGVMVQDSETVARRRASLPGTNGGGIRQLSVVRLSNLTVMTAHMLTGKAVSLPPTTKVVSGQAVRSGNSKTLHLVTHFHRRFNILCTS